MSKGAEDANFSRFLTDMVEQAARDPPAGRLLGPDEPVAIKANLSPDGPVEPISREQILDLLTSNNRAVLRALVVLQDRQTLDEQTGATTRHSNGVGWSRADARFGTSLAVQVRSGRHLSSKQLGAARKLLAKYVGQLVDAAQQKRLKRQVG